MKKESLLISLVLLLAVSLLACAAPPSAPLVKPIKVGVAVPTTGPYAGIGLNYFQGISMAVDDLNAEGGVVGRPLKIVRFDTRDWAPEALIQAADTLVGVEKVDITLGGWAGWGADVKAFGRYTAPFIHFDAVWSSIEVMESDPDFRNVFMVTIPAPLWGEHNWGMYVALQEVGGYQFPNHKLAIITVDDTWSRNSTAELKRLAEEAGWEVPIYETVPFGTTEWGTILAKIRPLDPAIIKFEDVELPDSISFLDQFMKDPTNSLLDYGYSMTPVEWLELAGEERAEGIFGLTCGIPPLPFEELPAEDLLAKDWVERFSLKYGRLPSGDEGTIYDNVKMWAAAVEAVGDPSDHAAVCQYLRDNPYLGILGLYAFNEHQFTPFTPELRYAMFSQLQDGEWVSFYAGEGWYRDREFRVPPWIEQ